jgi:predicted O-methyltransferase YrrM
LTSAKKIDFTPNKVQEYISGNFSDQPDDDWAAVRDIAKLTALRSDVDANFYISNFWRGPMLYSLVRRLKPRTILELGTGRGYGALSMALALNDGGIESKLITVDRTPADVKYDWAYVDSSGNNKITNVSLNDFWRENIPESLTSRIDFRCGDTADVHNLLADVGSNIDLVFIDGDHSYNGVALDFLSSYSVSAPNAVFVFDDYSTASGYGIRRLIIEDLSRFFSVNVIDMEPTAAHDISVDHMMAICNDEAAEIVTDLPGPSSFRFRSLVIRRWLRSQLVSVARGLLRR